MFNVYLAQGASLGLWILRAVGALAVAGLVSSYKYLPFAYQFRFWRLPLWFMYMRSPQGPPRPFQVVTRPTYCCALECDLFGFHKTNSSYFVELDLARTHAMLKAFHAYFWSHRAYVPLAEITTHFLKEIGPYEKYNVATRIVAVGEKWVYLVSLFVTAGKGGVQVKLGDTHSRVHAVSVGKLVFKDGRKTINPSLILEEHLREGAMANEKRLRAVVDDPKALVELFGAMDAPFEKSPS